MKTLLLLTMVAGAAGVFALKQNARPPAPEPASVQAANDRATSPPTIPAAAKPRVTVIEEGRPELRWNPATKSYEVLPENVSSMAAHGGGTLGRVIIAKEKPVSGLDYLKAAQQKTTSATPAPNWQTKGYQNPLSQPAR